MENKKTQGLGNKNLLSFPKHDSLKYWRLKKQWQQSYVDHFPICQEANGVSKESTCADNMKH
jgi:hypothetical protein